MKTIDLKKLFAPYYKQRRGTVSLIEIPKSKFLMVDGKGDPNTSPEFTQAVELLYSLSYTMKFMLKKDKKTYDYPVMPLEGLWWAKDMDSFIKGSRDAWQWTLMILQPEVITKEILEEAIERASAKKELPALGRQRLEHFDEGLCAQILHVGPYSEEGPTIQSLHAYIQGQGYALRGKHHEIYFGDPRRSNPETLKTILRQPVRKDR